MPGSVPASGSDLVAVDFDVSAAAGVGETGTLEITASGTADGQPIDLVLSVSLRVVAEAPEAQGLVGTGVPAPDPGGVDSDGDGVTNALETAFGSDPLDADSVPGKPLNLPALGATGLAVAVAGLLLLGAWLTRRRSARGIR